MVRKFCSVSQSSEDGIMRAVFRLSGNVFDDIDLLTISVIVRRASKQSFNKSVGSGSRAQDFDVPEVIRVFTSSCVTDFNSGSWHLFAVGNSILLGVRNDWLIILILSEKNSANLFAISVSLVPSGCTLSLFRCISLFVILNFRFRSLVFSVSEL